jgi:hypothetical protein
VEVNLQNEGGDTAQQGEPIEPNDSEDRYLSYVLRERLPNVDTTLNVDLSGIHYETLVTPMPFTMSTPEVNPLTPVAST